MELTVSSIIEEKMNEYWADENKVKQNFQDEKKRIGGRGRGGGDLQERHKRRRRRKKQRDRRKQKPQTREDGGNIQDISLLLGFRLQAVS